MKQTILPLLLLLLLGGCGQTEYKVDAQRELDYCVSQLSKSLNGQVDYTKPPRNILANATSKEWNCTTIHDWTSGFHPGILWYAYEHCGNQQLMQRAKGYSEALYPILDRPVDNHDLGFMAYCSVGNGLRLTNDPAYKAFLLRTADSLCVLFNPVVGTINSWPGMCKKMNWPHNTIIDNMINLELLFWAAKSGGTQHHYDVAFRHAETTMNNHFREDYSTGHVVVYDTISGKKLQMVTHQGLTDESTWARGQGWAVYGFTMAYRETNFVPFLETAVKAANFYLKNLPEDYVPYWDFNAPGIPNEPRDASAAALVASALIELQGMVADPAISRAYLQAAKRMLASLSAEPYRSGDHNNAFLLHATGHYPNNSEIDASIIYADYYYIEALTRLRGLQK